MDKILSLLPEVAVMQELSSKSENLKNDLKTVATQIINTANTGHYCVEFWDTDFKCPQSVQFLLKQKGYQVVSMFSGFKVFWEGTKNNGTNKCQKDS